MKVLCIVNHTTSKLTSH